MSHEAYQEMMFFIAFLASLGAFTKIVLAIVNRRRDRLGPDVAPRLEEIAERLSRLEQAADATALEVERISEGQRFTTKILADRTK
jgi:hypothetical protein